MGLSGYMKSLRARVGHDLLILPAVCGLVFDESGRVLLHRRSDTGKWAVIGGMADPGEEPADAVVREVFEETGVEVVPERITGVYNTPVITYPNGDQVQYVIATFRCRPVGGHAHVHDDESLEVGYFPVDQLPELREDFRQRIKHAVEDAPAFFCPPTRQGV